MTKLAPRERAPADPDDALALELLAECRGHLTAIRADLLSIAKHPAEIAAQQLVNRVFRAVHSVRAVAFLGLVKISELAQKMEDVLALIRIREMVLNSYRVGILLLASDRLDQLLQNSGRSNHADIGLIVAALERLYPNGQLASGQVLQDNRPVRMLAVDDDLSSRLLLKSFLSRYGECDVAANGREAVEAFRSRAERRQPYDLICMDITMPELDGREAVRQLRALEEADCISPARGVKIIIMTTIEDMKEMIGCFQDFSDAYLIKPINLVNLLRHLKACQLVR
jgi:two-component system chemotaxis response regulator CheY